MQTLALLADAKPQPRPDNPFKPGDIFLVSLWLVGAILVAALCLTWIRRLMRPGQPGRTTASDELSHYRLLHERGEMTDAEFQQIHALLTNRIQRQALGTAATPEVPAGEIRVEEPPGPTPAASPPPGGGSADAGTPPTSSNGEATDLRDQTGAIDGNASGQGQTPSHPQGPLASGGNGP
jgi:hypothetical protein